VVIGIMTMIRSFVADATVICSHPNLGITFSNVMPHSLETLQQWLLAAPDRSGPKS
jgi:hypothetical protein